MDEALLSKGKIIKGIGGFYYLLDKHGCIHECRAKGRFRKDGITPLTGDNALFTSGGFIETIGQRENELIRPRVANIDMAAIVVSAAKPEIDYLLCDKLLVAIKVAGVKPLIIINKCDIADKQQIEAIKTEYNDACETICISAKNGEGLDSLRSILSGRCTCFAGQSAAGKSSILNALFPDLQLETGTLSRKTDKGKHTTRQAELLITKGFSGTVVDTPGFSFVGSSEILPEELSRYYDDMLPYAEECRFSLCMHAEEPDCGVKKAVESGLIKQSRYQRYLVILKEIKEKRLMKYD